MNCTDRQTINDFERQAEGYDGLPIEDGHELVACEAYLKGDRIILPIKCKHCAYVDDSHSVDAKTADLKKIELCYGLAGSNEDA